MNKKITALAFAGFATLALSACSGNKAPTEERAGDRIAALRGSTKEAPVPPAAPPNRPPQQAPAIAAAFPRRRPPKGAMMLICARPLPP